MVNADMVGHLARTPALRQRRRQRHRAAHSWSTTLAQGLGLSLGAAAEPVRTVGSHVVLRSRPPRALPLHRPARRSTTGPRDTWEQDQRTGPGHGGHARRAWSWIWQRRRDGAGVGEGGRAPPSSAGPRGAATARTSAWSLISGERRRRRGQPACESVACGPGARRRRSS